MKSLRGDVKGFVQSASTRTKDAISSFFNKPSIEAPTIRQKPQDLNLPFSIRLHDGIEQKILQDDYSWMKSEDPSSMNLKNIVNNEKKYFDQIMKPYRRVRKDIYKELCSQIEEEEFSSVPELIDGYYYYTRMSKQDHFLVQCRKKGSLKATEQVIFDPNKEGQKYKYIHLLAFKISHDNSLAAYVLDTTGDESFSLYIKDIETGRVFDDVIHNVMSAEWSSDNRFLYYTSVDDMKRTHKLYRHEVGTPPSKDVLLLHEQHEAFFIDINRTKDKKYLTISINSKSSSEVYVLSTSDSTSQLRLIHEREEGLEYYVEHMEDTFYIVTNADGATNYQIVATSDTNLGKSNWRTVIETSNHSKIEDMDAFKDYLVVYERFEGFPRIRVVSNDLSESHFIPLPERICTIEAGMNKDFRSNQLRFSYSSPLTPECTYDYHIESRKLTMLRKKSITGLSAFKPEEFEVISERVKLEDSVRIPITIIKKKESAGDIRRPALITGYAAYGQISHAKHQADLIPLLLRGWTIAIAHPRGGGELGISWYREGRKDTKINSITDFVACTEFLASQPYIHRDKVFAYATSAGNVMLGGALNLKPHLYRGAIMKVPFVDVLSPMLDASLPLTVHEYDEWGNPSVSPQVLQSIVSYDPYLNISKQNYPSLFITASMLDNRVPLWIPLKYVAKIRRFTTDKSAPILLQIDEENGHMGDSGRFNHAHQLSYEYAFLLSLARDNKV